MVLWISISGFSDFPKIIDHLVNSLSQYPQIIPFVLHFPIAGFHGYDFDPKSFPSMTKDSHDFLLKAQEENAIEFIPMTYSGSSHQFLASSVIKQDLDWTIKNPWKSGIKDLGISSSIISPNAPNPQRKLCLNHYMENDLAIHLGFIQKKFTYYAVFLNQGKYIVCPWHFLSMENWEEKSFYKSINSYSQKAFRHLQQSFESDGRYVNLMSKEPSSESPSVSSILHLNVAEKDDLHKLDQLLSLCYSIDVPPILKELSNSITGIELNTEINPNQIQFDQWIDQGIVPQRYQSMLDPGMPEMTEWDNRSLKKSRLLLFHPNSDNENLKQLVPPEPKKRDLLANMQGQAILKDENIEILFRSGNLEWIGKTNGQQQVDDFIKIQDGARSRSKQNLQNFELISAFSMNSQMLRGLRRTYLWKDKNFSIPGKIISDYFFHENSKAVFCEITNQFPWLSESRQLSHIVPWYFQFIIENDETFSISSFLPNGEEAKTLNLSDLQSDLWETPNWHLLAGNGWHLSFNRIKHLQFRLADPQNSDGFSPALIFFEKKRNRTIIEFYPFGIISSKNVKDMEGVQFHRTLAIQTSQNDELEDDQKSLKELLSIQKHQSTPDFLAHWIIHS